MSTQLFICSVRWEQNRHKKRICHTNNIYEQYQYSKIKSDRIQNMLPNMKNITAGIDKFE